MSVREYKYAAFISYCHSVSDKKWAEWLIESLETYKIPSQLVELGFPKKMGKVYRDCPSSYKLSQI